MYGAEQLEAEFGQSPGRHGVHGVYFPHETLKHACIAGRLRNFGAQIPDGGGSISAGMAIHDTIQYIKCDVSTICMGMAASMGAFLLASGTKGKRFALPNAEIMIHQPLIAGGQGGGLSGQATDIKIHADHIIRTRAKMNRLLSEYTGQPLEKVEQDTERDNFLSAQEAKEYGLIDEVITHR